MKREEIVATWAGMSARERDAWVSVVVFGLVIERRPDGGVYEVEYGGARRILPHYTTDISAAWAVLTVFWSVIVERQGGSDVYTVIIRDDESKLRARASSALLPEAAGLAAIVAKLTEVSAE